MPAPKPQKCWSCGGTDMEDKGGWQKCRSCGATTVPLTNPSGPCMTVVRSDGNANVTHGQPHKQRAKKGAK